MNGRLSLAVPAVVALLPWTAAAQNAEAVIALAARAMGIQDLNSIGSYMYSGAGASFTFGQAKTPNGPYPRSEVTSYRRIIDFDAGASFESFTRPPGPGQTKEQTEIVRIPFLEPYGIE